MNAHGERPTVGHVNYSFFASTQSFIYHYLVAIRRFRSICLTRSPESESIGDATPAELEGDLYPYTPGTGSRGSLWSRGLLARRVMTRVPARVAEPVLDFANRRIAPRVRADADAAAYLDWAERVLRHRDARLIHAYFGPVGWRALELRRRLGVPLVFTSLGDDMAPSVSPWWSWWIQDGPDAPDYPARLRELFAEGDLFLAEGPHLRDQLIDYGCPPEKAQLQRMALPLDNLPFRARGPREDGRPVILFAGRFCAQKGVLYALEAVNELRREGRDFEFRLVGDDTMTDGGYAARVHSYIRANDLEDRVRVLGWQTNEACLREMQAADIFLHPSVVDDDGRGEGGAPTSILEAQALGMPVVSTLHCDIPYVTRPGESALLAPERDGPALAEALRTLLDDPGRWEAMGRAGRAHIEERHDIRREAERLEERYLALTGSIETARTWRLLRELRRGARRSPDDIAPVQGRLLVAAVRHAYEQIPFYRDRFDDAGIDPTRIRGIEDLASIPRLDAAEARRAIDAGELRARGAATAPLPSRPTGGTSGESLQVPRGPAEERLWRAVGLRISSEHGYRWRHVTALLDRYPSPPHTLQRLGISRTVWIPTALSPEEQAERLARSGAHVVDGSPTVLRRLARAIEKRGIRPLSPRTVFSRGEVLDTGTAKLVARQLGTGPTNVYGLTEVGYAAWQCERRDGLHVNADTCIVEVLRDGRAARPGEIGSVVVTDLRGRTAPLIRYETGDLAVAAGGPCGCGRTLPLLAAIEGRARDAVTLPDGRTVTTRVLVEHMAAVLAPDRYRLTWDGRGRFRLHLAGPDGDAAAIGHLARLLGDVEIETARGLPPTTGTRDKSRPLAPAAASIALTAPA